MPRTAVVCTDCRQPIAPGEVLLRAISSQLEPVAFHEECYRQHVPAPRAWV